MVLIFIIAAFIRCCTYLYVEDSKTAFFGGGMKENRPISRKDRGTLSTMKIISWILKYVGKGATARSTETKSRKFTVHFPAPIKLLNTTSFIWNTSRSIYNCTYQILSGEEFPINWLFHLVSYTRAIGLRIPSPSFFPPSSWNIPGRFRILTTSQRWLWLAWNYLPFSRSWPTCSVVTMTEIIWLV